MNGGVPARPAHATDHAQVAAVLDRVLSLLRPLRPAEGLSLTALSTLRTLDQEGAHRISDLAAREGVSQPAMTQLVTRLERDALAKRRADPLDRRAVVVMITKAGRELFHRRQLTRARQFAALLSRLERDDVAAIRTALPALERLAQLGRDTNVKETP
ncbi:MAG: MarR family transcriptional regulator [Micromonosporaceae bacterium]|nr:MarR family transcriptional regulator [Micromonosporaceae bacterium]